MDSFDQYKLWITKELDRHSSEIKEIGDSVGDIKSDIRVLQTKMLLATSIAATLISIVVDVLSKSIG